MDLLLNLGTLAMAVACFLGLMVLLFAKRKQLTKNQKTVIVGLLAVLVFYFAFVITLTIGFGSNKPPREPQPQFLQLG